MNEKSVLISTYIDRSSQQPLLPHLEALKSSNPSADIHIVIGEDSIHGRRYNWRNGDQPVFHWWQKHRDKVKHDTVALIEWDTFISCKIPDLPKDLDLAGKSMFLENPSLRGKWQPKKMTDPTWSQENWKWWREIDILGLKHSQTGIGLISFGFFLARKSLLDSIFCEKWRYTYEQDIVSELRLPTIAGIEGGIVGEIELPYVDHLQTKLLDYPGIYHPIKHQVQA